MKADKLHHEYKGRIVANELKAGDSVHVSARRWFDRVNGNTYYSSRVYVNGELVGGFNFDYGYDSMYMQTAKEVLKTRYIIPLRDYEALWRLQDHGIALVEEVVDVSRRKDLHGNGKGYVELVENE